MGDNIIGTLAIKQQLSNGEYIYTEKFEGVEIDDAFYKKETDKATSLIALSIIKTLYENDLITLDQYMYIRKKNNIDNTI